jgi:hypothetical protein
LAEREGKMTVWAGRIICAVAVLFLLFDSGIKLLAMAPAVEGTTQLGCPAGVFVPIARSGGCTGRKS